MRILIISDIHANLTALDTVLEHAGQVDAVWCLGDLVGYGPDPNECIARLAGFPDFSCTLGNHDAAVLDHIDPATFNPEARQAIQWTQETLTESSRAFLLSLPERVNQDHVTLAHGSPRQPVWEYLLDVHNATLNFEYFDSPYCFVGHTHLPVLYHLDEEHSNARLLVLRPNTRLNLVPRAIVNPGSVGQPRDRDPRASYAIYDPEEYTWEYYRVPYDIESVQGRMVAAGLPQRHIERLSGGW
jgi:predicted phosphodiesterase